MDGYIGLFFYYSFIFVSNIWKRIHFDRNVQHASHIPNRFVFKELVRIVHEQIHVYRLYIFWWTAFFLSLHVRFMVHERGSSWTHVFGLTHWNNWILVRKMLNGKPNFAWEFRKNSCQNNDSTFQQTHTFVHDRTTFINHEHDFMNTVPWQHWNRWLIHPYGINTKILHIYFIHHIACCWKMSSIYNFVVVLHWIDVQFIIYSQFDSFIIPIVSSWLMRDLSLWIIHSQVEFVDEEKKNTNVELYRTEYRFFGK